jgi:hypothetical protein
VTADPQSESFPDAFPNWSRLYHCSLDKLNEEGLVPFSYDEAWHVGIIIGLELQDNQDEILRRVTDELDSFRVPKWVALVCWTSPHGLGSTRPDAFLRVAKYLLGETKDYEEKRIREILEKHGLHK